MEVVEDLDFSRDPEIHDVMTTWLDRFYRTCLSLTFFLTKNMLYFLYNRGGLWQRKKQEKVRKKKRHIVMN